MCVRGSGWNELVIAAPCGVVDRRRAPSTVAPRIASELVRVSAPTRAESDGSAPAARIRCSSSTVPSAPAAKTTWSAEHGRRPANQPPVRTVETSVPTAGAGRTETAAVVSGRTSAPSRSASHR